MARTHPRLRSRPVARGRGIATRERIVAVFTRLRMIVMLFRMKVRWDDLETILEVWRAGTQERAAAALGLDQATVSRRLARLEQAAEVKLFARRGGRLVPTAAGEVFVERLAQVDEAVSAARSALATANSIAETMIRLVAPSILVDNVLAPALGALTRRYPGLKLDLVTRSSQSPLGPEFDLVMRLSKPDDAGLKMQRVAMMPYRIYAPAARPDATEWVGILSSGDNLREAEWIGENVARGKITVRVSNASTALTAVAKGVGRAVLPVFMGRQEPALIPTSDVVLEREIWVAEHAGQPRPPPVATARRWIDEALKAMHLGED
jgi:DNA-binding transcriptional LysR family regulator